MKKEESKFRKYLIFFGVFLLFLQFISFPFVFTFQCSGKTVSAIFDIHSMIVRCSVESEYKNCSYNWSSNGFLPRELSSLEITSGTNYTIHINCPSTKDYRCENDKFIRTGDVSGGDFSLDCKNSVCQFYIKPHEPINPISAFVFLGSAIISLILGFIISLKYKSWLGIILILFPIVLFILGGLFTPIC